MPDEMRVLAASTVLWVLIVVAATGGVSSWLPADSDPGSSEAVPQAEPVGPSWAAAGFGERFVSAYLAAGPETEGSLAAFLGYTPELPATEAPADVPRGVTAVGVERVANDYRAVTVAATVAGQEEFWRVGVDDHAGRLVATGLPTPVAVPTAGERPGLAVAVSAVPTADDPLGRTVAGFVAAYVCGDGDLSRYLAPGLALQAVRPAACADVRLDRWGSRPGGAERQLVVAEAVLDAGPGARRVSFALTLDRRDGRWEVAELLPAPPLAGDAPEEGRSG